MIEDYFIPIGGFTAFLIFLFVIIPYYYKRQQKIFLRSIQDRNYTIVKNVETDIETYSKLQYRFVYKVADIVFLEDEIFILIPNKLILPGAILQVGKTHKTYPGVLRKFTYTSKLKVDEQIEMKGNFDRVLVKSNFKIVLY